MLSTDRKRRGPKQIGKRGRGALARFRGCRPRKLSGRCPHPRVTAVAKKRNRRAACPLPGQRLSIFSVFRKAVHANAQLFCSLGPPRSRKSTASGQGEGSESEDREKRCGVRMVAERPETE